jgi:predicted nucleotidyltransferase
LKDSIEKRISEYFMNKKEVVAVYLFGSYARGKEKPFSDIDIGIIFKPSRRDKYLERIDGYLPGLSRIMRCDVHLVIMNTAGEELLKQVFTKGKCLLVNDTKLLSRLKTAMYSRIAEFGFYRPMMQKGLIGKIMGETKSG